MLIDIIAGARPNFVKIAPIIQELRARAQQGSYLRFRLVHTGQHYDSQMSHSFFAQLGIPTPDVNLEVGSGTQAEQTAAVMVRYEKLLLAAPSVLCLVVGDVNSTMACAITAKKFLIPVAHVEAGIRSYDLTMPEEINRIVTDSITDWFFTTSEYANENLRLQGVPQDRVFFVGNTMIDSLLANRHRFKKPQFFNERKLQEKKYFVLTLHRPANVDQSAVLQRLLTAIGEGIRGYVAIFPVHPRTAKTVGKLSTIPSNLLITEPQPYLEFNWLVENAFGVITDSGGITEEATVLGIPCLTLRDTTERPETVSVGTNHLVGTDPLAIAPTLDILFSGLWKRGTIPSKWDGRSASRIVSCLESLLVPVC